MSRLLTVSVLAATVLASSTALAEGDGWTGPDFLETMFVRLDDWHARRDARWLHGLTPYEAKGFKREIGKQALGARPGRVRVTIEKHKPYTPWDGPYVTWKTRVKTGGYIETGHGEFKPAWSPLRPRRAGESFEPQNIGGVTRTPTLMTRIKAMLRPNRATTTTSAKDAASHSNVGAASPGKFTFAAGSTSQPNNAGLRSIHR
jgi:hypothetical protein